MRLLLLTAACALPLLAAAPANGLVVPGRSLGNITLGASANTLAALGKSSFGDAAMQKAWITWLGTGTPRTQLDVYTASQAKDVDHHTVQVVRATSTFFHLAGGLRSGSSLQAIRAAYGRLPLATTYRLPAGLRYLYDDVRHGIAFETDGTAATSHCRALIVHLPGKAVTATYLSMPEYLRQVPTKP